MRSCMYLENKTVCQSASGHYNGLFCHMQNTLSPISRPSCSHFSMTLAQSPGAHYLNKVQLWQRFLKCNYSQSETCELRRQVICLPHIEHTMLIEEWGIVRIGPIPKAERVKWDVCNSH